MQNFFRETNHRCRSQPRGPDKAKCEKDKKGEDSNEEQPDHGTRAVTPGRSLLLNLKPVAKPTRREPVVEKQNCEYTKHFRGFMSTANTNMKRARSFSQPRDKQMERKKEKTPSDDNSEKSQNDDAKERNRFSRERAPSPSASESSHSSANEIKKVEKEDIESVKSEDSKEPQKEGIERKMSTDSGKSLPPQPAYKPKVDSGSSTYSYYTRIRSRGGSRKRENSIATSGDEVAPVVEVKEEEKKTKPIKTKKDKSENGGKAKVIRKRMRNKTIATPTSTQTTPEKPKIKNDQPDETPKEEKSEEMVRARSRLLSDNTPKKVWTKARGIPNDIENSSLSIPDSDSNNNRPSPCKYTGSLSNGSYSKVYNRSDSNSSMDDKNRKNAPRSGITVDEQKDKPEEEKSEVMAKARSKLLGDSTPKKVWTRARGIPNDIDNSRLAIPDSDSNNNRPSPCKYTGSLSNGSNSKVYNRSDSNSSTEDKGRKTSSEKRRFRRTRENNRAKTEAPTTSSNAVTTDSTRLSYSHSYSMMRAAKSECNLVDMDPSNTYGLTNPSRDNYFLSAAKKWAAYDSKNAYSSPFSRDSWKRTNRKFNYSRFLNYTRETFV